MTTPTPTLAHHLDPDSPARMTPARALRAVGLYLSDENDTPKTPRSISAAELRDRIGISDDAGRDAVGHYLDREKGADDWSCAGGCGRTLAPPFAPGDTCGRCPTEGEMHAYLAQGRLTATIVTDAHGRRPPAAEKAIAQPTPPAGYRIESGPHTPSEIEEGWDFWAADIAAVSDANVAAYLNAETTDGWLRGTYLTTGNRGTYCELPAHKEDRTLYRLTPTDPDPTTIDVSGTGLPGIVATEDGKDSDYGAWWWGDSMRYAAGFLDTGWAAYTPADVDIIASGPETGPEARRLAYAALQRYVASKRGDDAQ